MDWQYFSNLKCALFTASKASARAKISLVVAGMHHPLVALAVEGGSEAVGELVVDVVRIMHCLSGMCCLFGTMFLFKFRRTVVVNVLVSFVVAS